MKCRVLTFRRLTAYILREKVMGTLAEKRVSTALDRREIFFKLLVVCRSCVTIIEAGVLVGRNLKTHQSNRWLKNHMRFFWKQ